MAKRGRPSKSGKRTKSGRLRKPKPEVDVIAADGTKIVKGNVRAVERKANFGANGWDTLGRAYTVGLLGDGDEAKDRLAMGRQIAALYKRTYARGYRCALDDSPRGGSVHFIERDDAKRREDWLAGELNRVVALGLRPWFDQLVDPLGIYTDEDPDWLGRMIDQALDNRRRVLCGQAQIPHDERDWMVLRCALKALDGIQPMRAETRPAEITRAA